MKLDSIVIDMCPVNTSIRYKTKVGIGKEDTKIIHKYGKMYERLIRYI